MSHQRPRTANKRWQARYRITFKGGEVTLSYALSGVDLATAERATTLLTQSARELVAFCCYAHNLCGRETRRGSSVQRRITLSGGGRTIQVRVTASVATDRQSRALRRTLRQWHAHLAHASALTMPLTDEQLSVTALRLGVDLARTTLCGSGPRPEPAGDLVTDE